MACQVELKGFQPDVNVQEIAGEFEAELETLLDQAPSDAFASMDIVRGRDGTYKGHLQICSEQGGFIGKAWGNTVTQVREDLLDQVEDQLDVWRHTRFDHDGDTFSGEIGWLGPHHHGAA